MRHGFMPHPGGLPGGSGNWSPPVPPAHPSASKANAPLLLEWQEDMLGASRLDRPAGRTIGPKMAVVIASHNYEEFVGRAIDSVQSQGRDDVELVVVDDGSTDGSWDVIKQSGARAYRITNSGQRGACRYGADQTTAPFVLFLDADDELGEGCLDTILAQLDPSVAKLQFPLARIDAQGEPIAGSVPAIGTFRDHNELAREVLRSGCYVTPPTSGNVFRRDVLELLRDADYDKAVDGVILFAAPFLGDVISLSQPLGRYRIHGRNDSGVGQQLGAISLRRDIERFQARMEHLRTFLGGLPGRPRLAPTANMYFYRERSFYLTIVNGRQPGLLQVLGLLHCLWKERSGLKYKAIMSALFLCSATLPNEKVRGILGYRFSVGARSAGGLLKILFGRTAQQRLRA